VIDTFLYKTDLCRQVRDTLRIVKCSANQASVKENILLTARIQTHLRESRHTCDTTFMCSGIERSANLFLV